ncbi:hypothetical protein KP509_07G023900 [Ceratopteris richardii]|uniref:CNNM transmembrane domain-containing protein n=1 Tax=Ceratopteris richardii TaxID=49495 RepID=A0A8T2UCR4_CERRI|nr:hypothetical protein KP509_07G023900 [Ceratopteris richardii]
MGGIKISSLPEALDMRWPAGTWEDVLISLFLVLFGGLMSGLTLGLMSMDLVELEVLLRSGTPAEKKQAGAVLPIIKKQHQLLVTLVLCNAVAMEALPVFLDNMFSTLVAVILSVTFVLAFGEVIPQAICSRNGLAIGANFGWLVRILMLICFPVAYPVGKLLDLMLGHNSAALFRRTQLKAFVSIHAKEEGKGGELSHVETTIIKGALDLTQKIVAEAMTPIESTFSVDIDTKLDWDVLGRIVATGYSRVPVYTGDPKNLVGLLLVKDLVTVRAEDKIPLSAVPVRELPRVPVNTPLYDMLNQFQKGQSHMAAVVSVADANIQFSDFRDGKSVDNGSPFACCHECKLSIDEEPEACFTENSRSSNDEIREEDSGSEAEEIIGIITLEDVFEELIQEEIVDETDACVDLHLHRRVFLEARESELSNRMDPPSGQHDDSFPTFQKHGSLFWNMKAGRISNKPVIFPSLKPAYNLTTPLLDKA